jgi:regulator of RNase E activity RraA
LVRDLPGLKEAGLPVYARGVTPFGPLHRGPGELNYTVSCGGIVVNPGDIIVADTSGIAVVRREVAEDTIMRLRAHRARMEQYVKDVKAGKFSNKWVDDQLAADNCLVE